MERETALGSLDGADLLGLIAGLFIFLVGSHLRRSQPVAVRARSTGGRAAGGHHDVVVRRHPRR
jgi:hypothetical protein